MGVVRRRRRRLKCAPNEVNAVPKLMDGSDSDEVTDGPSILIEVSLVFNRKRQFPKQLTRPPTCPPSFNLEDYNPGNVTLSYLAGATECDRDADLGGQAE